jgi:hypothetical protein
MRPTLKDISEKIEPRIVETITLLDESFRDLKIQFFLVGVGTRHIFFTAMYGLPTLQRTDPVEFVARIKDWKQYGLLIPKILRDPTIRRHGKTAHRFSHANGTAFEIIPFEGLDNLKGTPSWSMPGSATKSVMGFEEALESSEIVRLAQNPPCDVSVCTPAALAISTLAPWKRDSNKGAFDATQDHGAAPSYRETDWRVGLDGFANIAPESRNQDSGKGGLPSPGNVLLAISKGETLDEIRHMLQRETMPTHSLGLQMRCKDRGGY